MKKTIVLVDHTSGRKFKIVIDPIPSCSDCSLGSESGIRSSEFANSEFPIPNAGSKFIETFNQETKILRIQCGKCKKELGQYLAEKLG